MAPVWRKLAVKQSALPPLLFQFSWSHEGYILYVSDLTFVWSEKLSYRDILERADDISATIDPSEDKEQFDLLLSKIEEALRGKGTAALNSGSQADSLQLTTTSTLPAPLRPLQWQIDLLKQAPSSLTDQLLLPLLKDEAGWESRQRILLDKLKEKDWALGKMYDKLESLGVEMGQVFPAAAGIRGTKKAPTRAETAKAIKGLELFDESKWLESSGFSSGSTGLAAEVLKELFGPDSHGLKKFQVPQGSWWTELLSFSPDAHSQSRDDQTPSRDASPHKEEPTTVSQHDIDLDQDGGVSTASSDEFEMQDTPPRLRAQRAQQAQSKQTPISPPRKQAKQSPKKQASKPQPDLPLDAGESTASDSEPEAPPPRQKRTPTPPKADPTPGPKSPDVKADTKSPGLVSPPKKKRGGLGVIGGKKKKEEKPPSPPAPSPPADPIPERKTSEDPTITPPKPKRTTKLGMIGGKKKAPVPSTSPPPATQKESTPKIPVPTEGPVKQEEPPKEPTKQKKEPSPVPEETEEQKAVRRREELKRQLAEKSKAPKKRRRL